jgi:hypothetical protein
MPMSPPLPFVKPVAPSNTLGIVGLVVSLVGLFLTCGLLSLPGLILSLIALRKAPRGPALIGVGVGVVGTVVAIVFGLAFVTTLLGMQAVGGIVAKTVQTTQLLKDSRVIIERARTTSGSVPTVEEGSALLGAQRDGWGTPLVYELDATGYIVRSAGMDQVLSTPDDLTLDADGIVRGQ